MSVCVYVCVWSGWGECVLMGMVCVCVYVVCGWGEGEKETEREGERQRYRPDRLGETRPT